MKVKSDVVKGEVPRKAPGKSTQEYVQWYFDTLMADDIDFWYWRMYDKSDYLRALYQMGRRRTKIHIPAQPSDFGLVYHDIAALLEVKEIKHPYSLGFDVEDPNHFRQREMLSEAHSRGLLSYVGMADLRPQEDMKCLRIASIASYNDILSGDRGVLYKDKYLPFWNIKEWVICPLIYGPRGGVKGFDMDPFLEYHLEESVRGR